MLTNKSRFKVASGRRSGVVGVVLTVVLPMAAVSAQGSPELEEIVVRASRMPVSVSDYPGSLTVIDQEALGRQAAFSQDIGSVLANMVPGFSTSPGSVSSFDTTLRGRSAVVLIDGVPVSPTLRQAGRDVASIDVSAIEQIDVIRGASAIYGNGGAGGVINYITKRPHNEGVEFTSKLGMGISLTHPGDSERPSFMQSMSGKTGAIDFVATASYEKVQSFFDADGDRVPPAQTGNGGLPDSDITNLFGKIGVDFGQQRIEASALYYDQAQNTDYFTTPGDVPTRRKATATRGVASPLSEDEGNKNLVLNTVYSHADVLGSTLRVQGFYQKVEQMFEYDPVRFGGTQSEIESKKIGGRIDLDTPFNFGKVTGKVLWGADYTNDATVQTMTDGRIFVPELDQDALAYFLQMEIKPTAWLDLQAGIRRETFDVDVASFRSLRSGVLVLGGTLDYSTTPVNAGFVIHAGSNVDLFAAFSQGFSLADIGRALRDTRVPGAVGTLKPEPVLYDNYETGVRFRAGDLAGEVSVFVSESDLGVNFIDDPLNPGLLIIDRKPEQVYGMEASLRGSFSEHWSAGGTLTWLEGKADPGTGDYDVYLDSRRIPPLKVTAFVEHQLTDDWLVRLQGLYSGDRDRFDNNMSSTGRGRIDSFYTFDLMSSLRLGPGSLTVGIQNLLNKEYYPVSAQAQNRAERLAASPGTTLTVQYAVSY